MNARTPLLIFILTIAALVLAFSCDDDGDQREQTRRALGEPDVLFTESYGTFESEYWVYAQRDIDRVYQFRRTVGSCGGDGKWYLYMRYEAYGTYFDFELYDHPPVITHDPVVSAATGSPVNIEAVIQVSSKATVDTGITGARLFYRTAGDSLFTQTGMSNTGDDSLYTAQIPQETVAAAGVEYYIEACSNEDTATSYHWSRLPELEDRYFLIEVADGAMAAKAGFTLSSVDGEAVMATPEPGDGAFSFTPMGQ